MTDDDNPAAWVADHFENWRRLALRDVVALLRARFGLTADAAAALALQAQGEALEARRARLRVAELARIRHDFATRGICTRGVDRRLIDEGATLRVAGRLTEGAR